MTFLLRCWFAGLLLFNGAWAATTTYRVDGYVSHTQSPFAEGIANGQLEFSDFENPEWRLADPEILPMPGISMSTPFGYAKAPSVDEDDGLIDGIGSATSLRSLTVAGGRPRFIFNFTPDAEGRYPRYFGIALPVGAGDEFGNRLEALGVKDAFGAIVLDYTVSMPSIAQSAGDTSKSTFIGIFSDTGISQVSMRNALWLDHLQYGYSIPEPSLLWVPTLALACRRSRSNPQLAHNRKRA